MKFLLCFVQIILLTISCHSYSDTSSSEGYEKLKSLSGDWNGTLPDGKLINISYEVINGGVVLERYHSKDPMWWNMSTAYHLRNDHIVMSHYCSWGNHPRMQASATEKNVQKIDFDFIDLAQNEPKNGYMRDLSIEFVDQNHLIHRWVWREKGKDVPLLLTLVRQ